METNEKKPWVNNMIDSKMRILMSIRNFEQDFLAHSKKIKLYSDELTSNYEKAVDYLNRYADHEFKKQWDELLNETYVHANQMNQQLTLIGNDFSLVEKHAELIKIFDEHKNVLYMTSKKLEDIGFQALPESKHEEWKTQFVVMESSFKPKVENEISADKFILDFISRYDKGEQEKALKIISENVDEDIDWSDPKQYEAQYIKAISEFQREFKPQNLWDSFMELLAGGVHPSPSERVMLEKWADGEQKSREDM